MGLTTYICIYTNTFTHACTRKIHCVSEYLSFEGKTLKKLFPVYVNATLACIKQQQRFPDKRNCPYWQYTVHGKITFMSVQPLLRQI